VVDSTPESDGAKEEVLFSIVCDDEEELRDAVDADVVVEAAPLPVAVIDVAAIFVDCGADVDDDDDDEEEEG